MKLYRFAWSFWIVGVGLACLSWSGWLPKGAQWVGAGIAVVGGVLSFLGRSKKARECAEPDAEEERTVEKGGRKGKEEGNPVL